MCTRDSSENVASIRRNSSHSTFGKTSASVSSASLREAVLASVSAEEETETEDLRRRRGVLALEERRDSIGHGGRGRGVAKYRKQWWARVTALSICISAAQGQVFFLTVSAEAVSTYAGARYNRISEQRPGNKIQ